MNINGPWFLLDGFSSRDNRESGRSSFASIRGFFIPRADLQDTLSLLRKYKILRDSIGDLPEVHDLFSGELPWSRDFLSEQVEEIEIYLGDKLQPILDSEKIVILINGVPLSSKEEAIAVNGQRMRTVPEFGQIPVEVPVISSTFGVRSHIDRPSGVIPSHRLCQSFDLWHDLPGWDMVDSRGQKASISTSFNVGTLANERMTYLRRELFRNYLHSRNLSFLWIVWGERNIYWEAPSRPQNQGKTYQYFSQIFYYENDKIRLLSRSPGLH
jgi:hypothetical protein